MATKSRATETSPPQAPSIETVFKQLQSQKAALDLLDDRLGTAISRVEAAMKHFVGIRMSIKIHIWDGGDFQALTFGKFAKEWILAIENGSVDHDGDDYIKDYTALRQCSRQMRAEVFGEGHVDLLVREALTKYNDEIKARELALAHAEQMINALASFNLPSESGPAAVDDDIPF